MLTFAAVVGLLVGRFVFAGRGGGGEATTATRPAVGASTEAQLAGLQERLRRAPDDARALTQLAVAYLARARETADPSYLAKAAQAVERSLALDSSQGSTMTAAGLVALARHDFGAALEWGRRAHAAAPDAADPLGVVVDAHIELGQYAEAASAAQQMIDRRPFLASLARVSYLRELHGDQAGAIEAMAQAVTAGSRAPADLAYVQAHLGDLRVASGEVTAAQRAYDQALSQVPGYGPAEVGLSRVAATRGDLGGAVARLEPVVRRLPVAEWAALLGDLHLALAQGERAAAQYDLVRHIQELNRASGVAVDLELARFEADHARDPGGRPEVAVALARTALDQRPTVFAEDAYGWALRQAGRPEEALPHARAAVRLGTADGRLWYHLAAVESDVGLVDDARAHVGKALATTPFLGVRDQPEALALADRLGVPRP
jgi:tetratricopeptide (TPR) repeat protein